MKQTDDKFETIKRWFFIECSYAAELFVKR